MFKFATFSETLDYSVVQLKLIAHTMNKVPLRVDGRFRLKELLGSGSYGMSFIREYYMLIQIQHMGPLYRAQNIINGDAAAVKLESAIDNDHSPSVEREYHILKQLEGGVGTP